MVMLAFRPEWTILETLLMPTAGANLVVHRSTPPPRGAERSQVSVVR